MKLTNDNSRTESNSLYFDSGLIKKKGGGVKMEGVPPNLLRPRLTDVPYVKEIRFAPHRSFGRSGFLTIVTSNY